MRTTLRLRKITSAAVLFCLLAGFDSAAHGDLPIFEVSDRIEMARSCVAGLTSVGQWDHDRPYAVESISRERWCREPLVDGAGSPTIPCEGGSTDLLTLRIEHDRDEIAVVDRMALNLSLAPNSGTWTVNFYGSVIRLDPGSTLGEGSYSLATVSVTRPDADGGAQFVSLTRFSFQVGDRVVMAPGEYVPPEELFERFRSAENLRESYNEQLDALVENVTELLDRGGLTICPDPDATDRYVCGPMGDGEGHAMYDRCHRRSLTEAETSETRARLAAEARAQRALILREYESIHSAVTEALAIPACWLLPTPPLSQDGESL